MNRALKLSLCLALPLVVGFSAALTNRPDISYWYDMLNKPAFNPPNNIFGPVWGMLYIFMGISLYRVTNHPASPARTKAIVAFSAQLILSSWWSFIFFSWHRIDLAFFEIIALWISVLVMIVFFMRIDRLAAVMQIPYLLWISFAMALNGAICQLNG